MVTAPVVGPISEQERLHTITPVRYWLTVVAAIGAHVIPVGAEVQAIFRKEEVSQLLLSVVRKVYQIIWPPGSRGPKSCQCLSLLRRNDDCNVSATGYHLH
ncbi:hypothetical protein Tdes44962_MAKER05727 [Teratosphaeria destructans]|uniref:Uncharacterized protein n=1 Tax=Teratosphaeria destructans TaxID=418781 RepID=A0A9W7SJ46_9PEZI|nr:hypothetical protein Tdes44962_MAKER05727 [Teratosphaeria destructans]